MESSHPGENLQMAPPDSLQIDTKCKHCVGLGWHLPSVITLLVIVLAQILPVQSQTVPQRCTWGEEQWKQIYAGAPERQADIFQQAIDMMLPRRPPPELAKEAGDKWMQVDLAPFGKV